jgi:hypothetical protein
MSGQLSLPAQASDFPVFVVPETWYGSQAGQLHQGEAAVWGENPGAVRVISGPMALSLWAQKLFSKPRQSYSFSRVLSLTNVWKKRPIFFFLVVLLRFELKTSLAKPGLYILRQASSPFCFNYFSSRVHVLSRASLDCDPLIYASHVTGMIGGYHHAWLKAHFFFFFFFYF